MFAVVQVVSPSTNLQVKAASFTEILVHYKSYPKCLDKLQEWVRHTIIKKFISIYDGKHLRSRGTAQQRVDLSPFNIYLWGNVKALVHLAPNKIDEILNQRIISVCQTTGNRHGISDMVRQSMIRHVHACNDSVGGHFKHFLLTVIC
jgi:hypothetical protein